MAKRLAGKVALVTGGSRGIGAATARALAEDGADVAISYAASVDKAEAIVRELEGKGVRAVAFQADQGDAAQVHGLVKAVVRRFGRLDILVNNAGVFVTGEVGDASNDVGKFDRQFAVNVGGVAAAVRAAATVMREGGRIISIGSAVGTRVPFPGFPALAPPKRRGAGNTRGGGGALGPRGSPRNPLH